MNFKNIIEKIPVDKVYDDLAQPTAIATGNLVSIIPRTIKAALTPLEIWITKKEFKLKETEKLLEEKLNNVSPEEMVSPEPYIAVPALQYIAYSLDNKEIRNMYANLLASSMTKCIKDNVHPSFVEIIKQLTPDEAKILEYIFIKNVIPLINIQKHYENTSYNDVQKHFSLLSKEIDLEMPSLIPSFLENLQRLKVVDISYNVYFSEETKYDDIKRKAKDIIEQLSQGLPTGQKIESQNGICSITYYGASFCKVCLD